ncbi:MAG: 23S rRNA (adenine(2503)-C(2))-methyltransferase RlmN, partial [Clostridia bacterium]|nr:23S rRNA (adenine(2503)-C(2))-methyltransferase RlmN [Clostridia bacterium]
MTHLLSLLPAELEALLVSLGEPKYRAAQMFPLLHRGVPLDRMPGIGKKTLAALDGVATSRLPTVRRKLVSALDGTVKYLFELEDGHCVESVVMQYRHGRTICISSQVGCRMGCRFCASTIGGKVRDLGAEELLGQVLAATLDLREADPDGERISNIVMMGIGEPLDN